MATEWAVAIARPLMQEINRARQDAIGGYPGSLPSDLIAEALDAAKAAGRDEALTREVERRREAEAALTWRYRDEALDTDDPILGYSPVCGDVSADEQPGHYAITTGRFLRQGGWEACTLWKPINAPVDRQGGPPHG